MLEWFEKQWPVWLDHLSDPSTWYQLGGLIAALIVTWFLHRRLGAFLDSVLGRKETRVRSAIQKVTRRLVFSLVLLFALLVARGLFAVTGLPHQVLDLAVPLALALVLVRLGVYLLELALKPGPLLRASENAIGILIWIGVALYLLGWLPALQFALDSVALTFGDSRISLLSIAKILAAVLVVMMLALWLARQVERWVMASQHISAGMRIGISKFVKVLFLSLGVVIALQALGINLSALTVFGGALGVGIGFGLQRITSNFISGFILVSDRSIQPRDVITVTDQTGEERFGWVQELRARYIVVRDRDGVATLIPNENLIVNPVVNWSYGHKSVRLKVPVQISYSDDPEEAMELMVKSADASKRVLKDPAPVCRLLSFGDNGIDLELRVWIEDPEEGINNIRSELNLAIWRAFKEHGITIPFPQRDVYIHEFPGKRGGGDADASAD